MAATQTKQHEQQQSSITIQTQITTNTGNKLGKPLPTVGVEGLTTGKPARRERPKPLDTQTTKPCEEEGLTTGKPARRERPNPLDTHTTKTLEEQGPATGKPTRRKQLNLQEKSTTTATQSQPDTNHEETETTFLSTTLTQMEVRTLHRLQKKWQERPAPRKNSVSAQWQKTQERFLELLCLNQEEMLEEFEVRRDVYQWTYGTASQYWSGLMKASETVAIPPTAEMRLQGKIYSFLKNEEDPKRKTIAITEEQIVQATRHTSTATSIAIRLSFALGQRFGDTLKVETANVGDILDTATNTTFLYVTYRKGKTTRRRAPYTVHLLRASPLAQEITDLQTTRTKLGAKELFCTPDESLHTLREARIALKEQSEDLCILSIRRGGLQRMALSGMSQECMMHHSRHSTKALLDRYLEWGRLSLDAARELHSASQH